MNKVIFRELLIADIENKVARLVNFKDGKNLLTSHSNHVGKSLICKSLYYVLGAEAFFSEAWKNVNSLYWLKFSIDEKEYKIVRKGSIFTIYEPNGTIQRIYKVKNLSNHLNRIFGLDIRLVAKDGNQSFVSSSPVFMYMPYYIDQENGWTKVTMSFDRLNQFNKVERKTSLFYHLGCLHESYVMHVLKRKELEEKQNKLNKEYENCKHTIDFLQGFLANNGDLIVNEEELNYKIDSNKIELNKLLKQLDSLKNEIIKLENEKAIAEHTKQTIESFIKKEKNSNSETQDVKCPNCGYEFSIDFKERFHREYLLETINTEMVETALTLNKCNEKLEGKNKSYIEVKDKLKRLESNIMSDEALYETYIKIKSARLIIRDNDTRIGEICIERSTIADEIKRISKTIKEYQENEVIANNTYSHCLAKLFAELSISSKEVGTTGYYIGDEISAGGAYKDRVILAKYYAFLQTKRMLADNIVKFPFVIDSPRGAEQDKENAKIIMEYILNDNSIDNQIIVSTIDGKDYVEDVQNLHIIELNNEKHHLLCEDDYNFNEVEIVNAIKCLAE